MKNNLKKDFYLNKKITIILFISILLLTAGCGALISVIASAFLGTKAGFVLVPLIVKENEPNQPIPGMLVVFDNNTPEFSIENYTSLKDAKIAISGSNKIVTTDENGYFYVSDLPEGIIDYIVEKDNYVPVSSKVPVGANTIDNMKQFYVIPTSLHLISERSYQIKAYGITGDNHIIEPSGVTWDILYIFESVNGNLNPLENNGIASINSEGILTAKPPGYYPIWVIARARANNFSSTSEIIVTPGSGFLSGRVTYVNNNPVEGAKVQVGLTPYFTITDTSGNYSFPEVPGDITINITAQYGTLTGSTVTLINSGATGVANIIIKTSASKFIYVGTIGTTGISGNSNYQFNQPQQIAFDSKGNFYVSDAVNQRVQKFGSNNKYLATIGKGIPGSDNDSFNVTAGLTVDNKDNLYVCDTNNYRVQKFDSNGKYLQTFGVSGQSGSDNTHFSEPTDVATDKNGNIYVSDSGNYRVQKFDSSGKYLMTIGETGVFGIDNKHFSEYSGPTYIGMDGNDNLYVSDSYPNERVQIYDSSGKYIATMGQTGIAGADDNHFHFPTDIGFDSSGNIFIADYFNHRVQVFDANRLYIDTIGKSGISGNSNSTFEKPMGVAISPVNGEVYVTDSLNHRIQIFKK